MVIGMMLAKPSLITKESLHPLPLFWRVALWAMKKGDDAPLKTLMTSMGIHKPNDVSYCDSIFRTACENYSKQWFAATRSALRFCNNQDVTIELSRQLEKISKLCSEATLNDSGSIQDSQS